MELDRPSPAMHEQRGSLRSDLLYRAHLCREALRFEEMMFYTNKIVEMHRGSITREERDALVCAYHNTLSRLRVSYLKVADRSHQFSTAVSERYKKELGQRMLMVFKTFLELCEMHLRAPGSANYLNPFCLKTQADFYYMLYDTLQPAEKEAARKTINQWYEHAWAYSNRFKFADYDPTLMGLTLNHASFLYHVLKKQKRGAKMALTGYTRALRNLRAIDGDAHAAEILAKMHKTLRAWKSENKVGSIGRWRYV